MPAERATSDGWRRGKQCDDGDNVGMGSGRATSTYRRGDAEERSGRATSTYRRGDAEEGSGRATVRIDVVYSNI
ncbi:hypothetical protein EW026_g7364 [Hermanssonia centrifuga]|uniref:Uncharacterized protein n=1 Tax=Hermanssonia centrifuga TaxID=98765 RepID=A0A4S4KCJ4_9APHY|nr:hypothetical protein EW026_g7364 [Hermanssonia centrifuga]